MENARNEILWGLVKYNAYFYVIMSNTLFAVSFEILHTINSCAISNMAYLFMKKLKSKINARYNNKMKK